MLYTKKSEHFSTSEKRHFVLPPQSLQLLIQEEHHG